MAYTKYSLTPANNNATPPDGAPEGMLPSAVNDTMRDMMSQIRDCGDGIRDGTYTMTAPKITGGTITGATFTGNTFSNPIITGVSTFAAGTVSAPAITTTGDTNTGIFFPAADTIAFTEGGAEAMRIDSGGNVGIGVTPSTYTVYKALEIGAVGSGIAATTSGTNQFNAGYYYNSADKFAITGNYAMYSSAVSSDGSFRWYSSTATGTAGNDATMSERMRITSSGVVGIGTSSPAGKLQVKATTNISLYVGNSGAGSMEVGNYDVTDGYNPLLIDGSYIAFATGTTGGQSVTERMRITSGGQVCINATAAIVDANSKFVVNNRVASGVAAEFSNNVSGTACVLINNEGAATSTLINWYAANAFRSSVTWNGTNIIYGTPSDQRLKENIVDSNSALPLINDIKIRSFDWKENGNHIDFGVIAQELENVMPEAVLKGKDNEDGSIKESWSVDTSTLVPAMIKAIQEQQAMIEELKAEIALLKSK